MCFKHVQGQYFSQSLFIQQFSCGQKKFLHNKKKRQRYITWTLLGYMLLWSLLPIWMRMLRSCIKTPKPCLYISGMSITIFKPLAQESDLGNKEWFAISSGLMLASATFSRVHQQNHIIRGHWRGCSWQYVLQWRLIIVAAIIFINITHNL